MKKILAFGIALTIFCINAGAQIFDTLPVIVHIIYNGENVGTGTNLDSTQVYSQFTVLNQDYRMLNADLANTPAVFAPLIADMGLNFSKALVDPNGNPLAEPGIDRINRQTMGWTTPPYSLSYIDGTIKPNSIWDPTHYLNIWVMNVSAGLLGTFTFPANSGLSCLPVGTADPLRDGIVVHYCAFGNIGNVCTPFDKGRTATYEIAQWLGLRRLAQVSCGDDCVADTPPGDYSYGGCPSFPQISSSCPNGPDGDMFMNFLSYVDDGCKVMFTQGQKSRIDTCLTNGTYQSALRLSNVGTPTGIVQSKNALNFSIYPNPFSDRIILNLPQGTGEIKICNVLGENILSQQFNTEKTEIDLSAFAAGVYFVTVKCGNAISTKKIIRQ
jgi:hypothetical protein